MINSYRHVKWFLRFARMGHAKEVGGNNSIMLEVIIRIIIPIAIMGEAN